MSAMHHVVYFISRGIFLFNLREVFSIVSGYWVVQHYEAANYHVIFSEPLVVISLRPFKLLIIFFSRGMCEMTEDIQVL